MGTLGGHLLPGSFFLAFAIWWSFITSIRYVQSKLKSPFRSDQLVGYKTTSTMPCICLPSKKLRRAPIESWVKVVLASIGLIGEFITAIHFNYIRPINKDDIILFGCDLGEEMGHSHHQVTPSATILPVFFEYVNAQHITMYSAFILGGIVEIILLSKKDIPRNLDMACGFLAFSIEAFLFAFHLHSRAPLDIRLHVLLVYSIYGCMLCCALEIYNPNEILFTYGRILFTCLQGSWFWQTGFILYPPANFSFLIWDRCNHEQVMTATMMFCWHVILIFIGLLLQLWIVKRAYRVSKKFEIKLNELIVIDYKNRMPSNEDVYEYDECPVNDENDLDDMVGFKQIGKNKALDAFV